MMMKGVKFNDMYECDQLAHELMSHISVSSPIPDPDIVDVTYDCYMTLTNYNEKMVKRFLLLDYCLLEQMEKACAEAKVPKEQVVKIVYPIKDRLYKKILSIEEEP